MTTLIKTGLDQPISSRAELRDYLLRGARSPERWGVGVELEKLVLECPTGRAASFARIETLLRTLEAQGGWQPLHEGERLLGLKGERSSITLEPGGQLELSGELCPDIHCSQGDFARHVAQVVGVGIPSGLCFLGLGVQPFTPLETIDWLPKARYGIMGRYMARTGDMGQRMMKQTAGLQVNLDFADEADCIAKLRLGQALSPLFYALFANSPLMDGIPTGHVSTRGEIWSRTDPDRTGFIPGLFSEGATLDTYVDYVLSVPMYFIVREGRFVDLTAEPFSFRRYLAEGFRDERATLADWDLHLSTIFTEVRLRPQIELRSADALPPRMSMAPAALAKGLLYDHQALEDCWGLFGSLDDPSWSALYGNSWRLGLRAPFGRGTLRDLALEVLDLARDGLMRQKARNERGLDESVYLEEVREVAESGVTLAERLLGQWKGEVPEKVALLKTHCGFGESD